MRNKFLPTYVVPYIWQKLQPKNPFVIFRQLYFATSIYYNNNFPSSILSLILSLVRMASVSPAYCEIYDEITIHCEMIDLLPSHFLIMPTRLWMQIVCSQYQMRKKKNDSNANSIFNSARNFIPTVSTVITTSKSWEWNF